MHAVISTGEGFSPANLPTWGVGAPFPDVPIFSCPLRTPRTAAEALGVREYLVKPVSQDRLTASLRRWGGGLQDIVIVEDDAEMSELLACMVGSISPGCQIHRVADGRQGLQLLQQRRPDVILLDLVLPTLNGYELIHAIQSDPALRDVPIIIVSARGAMAELVRADALKLSRAGGLSVGEVMRCLRSTLDELLRDGAPDTSPAPPAAPAG